MTWSAPMTAVSGSVFTAAQFNQFVRDNLLECPASLATTTGSFFAADAANSLVERIPAVARIDVQDAITSTSYVDATNIGPSVTVTTGQHALILITAELSNNTASASTQSSVAISGATTESPGSSTYLRQESSGGSEFQRCTASRFHTGLTPGSNTFKMQYSVSSGIGQVNFREIIVIPF